MYDYEFQESNEIQDTLKNNQTIDHDKCNRTGLHRFAHGIDDGRAWRGGHRDRL